jgi:hypothetical protein
VTHTYAAAECRFEFGRNWQSFVRTCLDEGRFAPQALEKLVRAQNTLTQLTPHVWAVLVLELWCRAYLDEQ